MSTYDLYYQKYKEASDEVRAFIDSEKIPTLAQTFCSNHADLSLKMQDVVVAVSDYIVGVTDAKGLRDSLGLTDELASEINKKIQVAKDGVLPEANRTIHENLELKPESAQEAAYAKPLTREELLNALAAKRTMASDIESVQKKNGETLPPQNTEPKIT